METIQAVMAFLHGHQLEMILGMLLGIEQALAAAPGIAANSTYQLISKATKGAKDALFPPKPDPAPAAQV
jgi:hypothetical protein